MSGALGWVLFVSQSYSQERHFYVEKVNKNIDIVPTSNYRYRVYVYDKKEERGKDYIDIERKFSDIPNISLCFPKEEKNKVYIIDRYEFVENYDSSDLDFVYLYKETVENGELISREKWERWEQQEMRIDSVTDSIPSITVRLNANLKDLSVWENQKYLGEIKMQH